MARGFAEFGVDPVFQMPVKEKKSVWRSPQCNTSQQCENVNSSTLHCVAVCLNLRDTMLNIKLFKKYLNIKLLKKKKPRNNDHRNQESEIIFKAMLLVLSALLKHR